MFRDICEGFSEIHSKLMSNHTTKMTKVSTEINANLHFSQILHGETFLEFTFML